MTDAIVDEERIRELTGGTYTEHACSADTITQYPLEKCLWAGKTPFCDVVIGKSPVFGTVLFLDGEIQSAESDEAIYHQHLVHPVMNASAGVDHKMVLIVGGGEGATAREVLKWSPTSVDEVHWVDIDGPLVELCRRHMCFAADEVYSDRRLHFFAENIWDFLKRSRQLYDVIILDLPDPDVDELKKDDESLLYSESFMYLIKTHLRPSGAVVSHTGPVAPGANAAEKRAGLEWIKHAAEIAGFPTGCSYHTFIPSFASEWGFWMSCPPNQKMSLTGLSVMDNLAQSHAFTWPTYWFTLP